MTGRIVLLSLISTYLLFALVVEASATKTRTVGVSVDNKFRYSFTVSWNSTDPSAIPSSTVVELNNTEWGEVNVTGISGTYVYGQMTSHVKNDTETTTSGWVDVNTGNTQFLTASFISANLIEGDSLYTSSQYNTWFTNETVTRTYSGVKRDTNHFSMTSYSRIQDAVQTSLMDFHWDKSTGILVETLQETSTIII